ncbi:MAG: MarC family protein, partial [Comamonas sp.]|nr:MarC family protein [Comamonas sp.]
MSIPFPDLFAAFGKSLFFAMAGILPIISPLASAPIFVDLTQGLSKTGRHNLARQIGKNVFLLLAGAMLAGSYVLHFFGVSLPVVRVAGGMIVASIAWRMLHAPPASATDTTEMANALTEDKARIKAFYPLTFPLTCGPGTLAVTIALGASLFTRHSVSITMANVAGGLLACALLGLLVGATYRYA